MTMTTEPALEVAPAELQCLLDQRAAQAFATFSHQRPVAQSDLPIGLADASTPPLTPARIECAVAAIALADTTSRLPQSEGQV